jgi:selenium-binding protein 1
MSQILDPTFYRSPADAMAAPPERLAYVAAFDPAGKVKDAMTVIDCDPSSPGYGKVVGWSELPTAGNELHHLRWNACSSALCHQGHGGQGTPLTRRAERGRRDGHLAWVAGRVGSSSGWPRNRRACSVWVAGHGETPSSSRSSCRSWS